MNFIKNLFYEKLDCDTCGISIRKGKGHTVSGTSAEKMILEYYDRKIENFRADNWDSMVRHYSFTKQVVLQRGEYVICGDCFARILLY